MQEDLITLQINSKKLLGCFHGDFAELLEVLHKLESGLAGAGTGSFVSLNNLSLSVELEEIHVLLDFLYKIFHGVVVFNVYNG